MDSILRPAFLATAAVICTLTSASALPAQDWGAFERGRTLTRWLLQGEVDTLHNAMSRTFLDAVGGRGGVERLVQTLHAQAGVEQEVLREEAFHEGGLTTYYRISRFEKLPGVTTRWVWNAEGGVVGATVTPSPVPAASDYLDYQTKAQLRLPFRAPSGGMWYVAWGGRDPVLNYHVVAPDQRFAYDFIVIRGDSLHAGDGGRNEDYYCFGEPVYAPAAGRIVTAVDSVADNARPGVRNAEAPPGNYVVVDHGGGERSLLAHLRRGSVAVLEGDAVEQGDLLGSCGNSGNSSLPHVHYHLQTGSTYKEGVGLPAFFHAYFVGARYVARGEPLRGQVLVPYVQP
jgi:murein DD-endopeptidase MepM/ murein hydrolase activator NlpD